MLAKEAFRQRISIARAMLKKSPIILLDEATSSLDSETEEKIQNAISILTKNKTTIVIAHRLSTILNSEKIFVVEKGKILASGNHEELLKISNQYNSIVTEYSKKNKNKEQTKNSLIDLIYKNDSTYSSNVKPILATGFVSSLSMIEDLFDWHETDSYALLNEHDESRKTPGLFLVGPQVRHEDLILCSFISVKNSNL